ncbi:MAG TPA: LysM peptidoglycan-binding domain-containing protein [Patescibacteria group bacterium]
MRDNLKHILKLFFDLRIVLLLILFFLLGVFMGRFIWEGERRDQITSGEVSPSPITSLEEVRNLEPEAKRNLLPVTYVVQPGDSSWRIAEAFYGDPHLYPEIEKANNLSPDQDLEVGQELSIPRVEEPMEEPTPESQDEVEQPADEQVTSEPYIVQANDSLWFIALKYLNDGTRWVEIYQHNRPAIGNDPNLIYPGQTLILPAE